MLKWQFAELAKYKQEALNFEETVDIKEALLADFGDLILDATPLNVKGMAQADQEDIIVHARVTGELTVPSSRSLKPVQLPVDFEIDEVYLQDEGHQERYGLEDSVIMVEDGLIDFLQAVVEFTVLQVPLQILTPEEENEPMPQGNEWAVMTEDEYAQQKQEEPASANTPLANLKDLFSEDND